MFPIRITRWTLACLLVALPGVARAQSGATNGRVFSSLFGGAADTQDSIQALDFNAALYGGYDDNLLSRGTSGPQPDAQQLAGTFVGAQASIGYRRQLARGGFSASAQTSYRYLTDEQEVLPTYHAANVNYFRMLGPRTSLSLNQRVSYRPYFSVVPFPTGSTIGPSVEADTGASAGAPIGEDIVTDPGGDFSLASNRDAVTYGGTANLLRELTPRSNLSFVARYAAANFLSSDIEGYNNLRWGVAGTYTYRISDYLGARLGYGYRRFDAQDGGPNDNHDINIGLLYNQPFVIGQGRTTLSFTTGSTMLVREEIAEDGSSRDRFRLRMLGSATLAHDFVGPWQAQLSYIRAVGFLDGLTEPFVGDRVVASLGGFLGRRTDLFFQAGYVSGSFGLSERNFDTAVGGVRLRTAVTRNLALFAQYFYYQYTFAESVAEDLFVPAEQERQGFRAGLTVWVPMLR